MQAASRAPLNGDDENPEPTSVERAPDDSPDGSREGSTVDSTGDSGEQNVDLARTPPIRRTPFLITFWLIGLVGLGLDQATKQWATSTLEGRGSVPVLGDWLNWHLTFNSGASFSMGTSYTEVLSVLALAATIFVVYLSFRLGSRGWAVGLGFLLAGVGGNLTDRLFRAPGPFEGHVVDFIALPNWPIFNLADICINVAAVLIIVQTIRGIRLNGTLHD